MSSSSRKRQAVSTSAKAQGRGASAASPEMRARKIAEVVQATWHRAYGSERVDVPISVIATVAALPQTDSSGQVVADSMGDWDADGFLQYARHTWSSVIKQRPGTTHLLWPVIAWIFDDAESNVVPHAHALAQAALRAGQTDLTGTDLRFGTDLLGIVLTMLRPKSALQARGQFYTPADVAGLMARMSSVEEHRTVIDPVMGTGGMFRAAAESMRAEGGDPRTVTWAGCDIDEIAVACATINSMIWGLGEDIVFHAGNALTEGWEDAARAQRDELRRLAAGIERDKRFIALLKDL